MKVVNRDAMFAYLQGWERKLRESGECGGCAADMLKQVTRELDGIAGVWCDPEYELPADSDHAVLAVVDGDWENIRFRQAYQLAVYLGPGEGWMLEEYPLMRVRVRRWMELPDWEDQ